MLASSHRAQRQECVLWVGGFWTHHSHQACFIIYIPPKLSRDANGDQPDWREGGRQTRGTYTRERERQRQEGETDERKRGTYGGRRVGQIQWESQRQEREGVQARDRARCPHHSRVAWSPALKRPRNS